MLFARHLPVIVLAMVLNVCAADRNGRLSSVVAVQSGTVATSALTSNVAAQPGDLIAWGDIGGVDPLNDVVQIAAGDNTFGQATVPANVSSGTVKMIAASEICSFALMSDNTLVGWGEQSNMAMVKAPASLDAIQICVGYYHACGLIANNTITCWGDNRYGQLDVPNLLSSGNVVIQSIACGAFHNLALAAGRVYAWGDNGANQTAVPSNATFDITTIAAGGRHSLALKPEGTVIAWGDNGYAQTDVPSTVKGATSIAAGFIFSLALLEGGVIAWGDNSYGEGSVPTEAQSGVTYIASGPGSEAAYAIKSKAPSPPPLPPSVSSPETPISSPRPPLTISSPPLQSPPPSPSVTASSSSNTTQSRSLSRGAIAGIVAGAAVVLLVVVFVVLFVLKRKQANTPPRNDPEKAVPDATAHIGIRSPVAHILDAAMDIPGLAKGDFFTRTTAHSYQWSPISHEQQQAMVAVEAGITDEGFVDRSGLRNQSSVAVQLSEGELQQQVKLLANGLVGKGATGLVFKCIWPSRFGPNALLAAKVMKDGFDSNPAVLQSFSYEASVLASLQPPHPNVVRLYGYCLQPPTVCLIMELLPCSLKDVLYRNIGFGKSTKSSSQTRSTSSTVGHLDKSVLLTSQSTHVPASSSEGTSTSVLPTSEAISEISTSDNKHSGISTLTMRHVLKISIDIASGLKLLHEKPLVSELAVETGNVGDLEAVDDLAREEASNLKDPVMGTNATVPVRKSFKIVHRDLKPANILFNSAGQAKISDFGLARPQNGSTLITDHVGAGTLPYMAPELLAGSTVGVKSAVPASNRVDVYSTAMIMWEMLARCAPWHNMNDTALMASVMGGRRPHLPSANDKTTTLSASSSAVLHQPAGLEALPEFNAIIRACWQHREQRRPTAEALYDMLAGLLAMLEGNDSVQMCEEAQA